MSRVYRELRAGPLILIGLGLGMLLLSLLLPYPELQEFQQGPWSLRLLDRHGSLLQVLPVNDDGLRREYRSLDQYPEYLPEIFLAGEDRRFFFHPGVDPAAVARAALDNLRAGRIVSGASTVSMQLAGRVSPAEPGLAGKIGEAWNALRLELRLSKHEILELWLNSLPLGSNVEGVAAGAREVFGHDAELLSPEESALLALIPRNPSRNDPRRALSGEQLTAAALLLETAGIPSTLAGISRARDSAAVDGGTVWPFLAPHFVLLAAENWPGDRRIPVYTTLDLELQQLLEAVLASRVEKAREYRIGNGAALVLDIPSGGILAYVGSKEFFDTESRGQIDGVRMLRQPGSTIKPFLYSLALERGMTPATLLPDVPLSFGGEAVYIPLNFSNTYRGPVRLRVALASSLNIPAVYTVTRVGVSAFVDRLLALGFNSLQDQREQVGSGIALGNAGVSLLELTAAFAVFQRGGVYLPPVTVAAEQAPGGEKVMEAETAFLIRDILSENSGRIPGFGTDTILNTPFPAMFKTGTSNQFTNIWALGATGRLATGVWMGNFTGETVIGRPGSSIPAAAAVEFLKAARGIDGYGKEDAWESPSEAGLHEIAICSLSGEAAGPYCPGTIREYFLPGTEPAECSFHRSWGTVLPARYREWASMEGISTAFAGSGELRILSPASGSRFFLDPELPATSQSLSIEAEGSGSLLLYLDGELLLSGETVLTTRVPLSPGDHRLLLRSGSDTTESFYIVR